MKNMEKKKVLVFVNNHFDLIWRRCFDREITYKGDTFVSYAEIEDINAAVMFF